MFVWIFGSLLVVLLVSLLGLTFLTFLRQARVAMQENLLLSLNGPTQSDLLRRSLRVLNVESPIMIDWYRRERQVPEAIIPEPTYTPATELIPGPLILPIPYQKSLLYADDLSQMSGTTEDTERMRRAS